MPRLFSVILSAAILLFGAITCLPLIREKAVQRRVELELRDQLHAEEVRAVELAQRIVAARTDPATVERLAREKFGLARPGEIIFKFRGDWPPGTPPNGGGTLQERPSGK